MVRGLPTEHQRSRTPITKTPRSPRQRSPAPPAHQPNRPARFAPCSGPSFALAKSRPTCSSVSSNSGRTARAGSSTSPPRHGSPTREFHRGTGLPPREFRERVRPGRYGHGSGDPCHAGGAPPPRDWLRLSSELGPMALRSGQLRRLAGQAELARRGFSPARELVGQTLTPNPNNRNRLSLKAQARHAVPGTKNRSAQKTFPTQPPNLFPAKFAASPRARFPTRSKSAPPTHGTATRPGEPRLPPDHARARKSGSSPRSLPDRSQPDRFLPAAATAR